MLLQLRDYIQREKRVSTQQLVREFHIDVEALQPMLDIWVYKGVIATSQESIACGTVCKRCHVDKPVYYQFCM